jgi:hypothetical protein
VIRSFVEFVSDLHDHDKVESTLRLSGQELGLGRPGWATGGRSSARRRRKWICEDADL